jgi:hypothetical protein
MACNCAFFEVNGNPKKLFNKLLHTDMIIYVVNLRKSVQMVNMAGTVAALSKNYFSLRLNLIWKFTFFLKNPIKLDN